MKGYLLAELLSNYPRIYSQLYDIVTIEQLPDQIPIQKFVIVNFKSHWRTLYHSEEFGYELFDSLGWSSSFESGFIKKLPKSYQHISTNRTQVQSSFTKAGY